jgi:hypothetical protein
MLERIGWVMAVIGVAALLAGAAYGQQCYTVNGKLYCQSPNGSSKQMYCWTAGSQTFCS